MNPMVLAALISGGSRLLGGLLGGGGTKLTGRQANWLAELEKMYRGGMPDWMRSDITSTKSSCSSWAGRGRAIQKRTRSGSCAAAWMR